MLSRNEILRRLKSRDKATIELIYKCLYPGINKWVSLNSGTMEDAEDVFHDSLICILIKLDSQTLQLTCDFSTYFISICRNKWFQTLYKRRKMASLTTDNFQTPLRDMNELAEMEEVEDQKYHAYLEALHDLDPKSQAVMEASLNGKSNEEIAAEMGFINSQTVADKKKNCKKKLIRSISGCSVFKDQMNEAYFLHRTSYK